MGEVVAIASSRSAADRNSVTRAKLKELLDAFLSSALNDAGYGMTATYIHMMRGPFKPFIDRQLEALTPEQCEGIRALAREIADY